jgi:hypothetical protein
MVEELHRQLALQEVGDPGNCGDLFTRMLEIMTANVEVGELADHLV